MLRTELFLLKGNCLKESRKNSSVGKSGQEFLLKKARFSCNGLEKVLPGPLENVEPIVTIFNYLSLCVCSGGSCGRQLHSMGAYKKAAVLGSYEACDVLGYLYASYLEMKNINKATYWLCRAVELADPAALRDDVGALELLGYVYLFGSTDLWGLTECSLFFNERDYKRGLRYLEHVLTYGGSERKDPALRGLGIAYACGLGVERDEKQSALFFNQLDGFLLSDVGDVEKCVRRKKNIDRTNQRLIKNVKECLGIC